MSNRVNSNNPRNSFKQAYRLARTGRKLADWQGQTFEFPGGYVYIADSCILIKRSGFLNNRAAFYADFLINATFSSVDNRRYFLNRSKDYNRVPLP